MKFTVGDGCSRGLCRRGCGRQDRQLNTYDWLADVPGNAESTDLVEVQFKNTRKGYYHNVNALDLKKGDVVAVEASPGHDIGVVTLTGKLVKLQVKKANLKSMDDIKRIYRIAKPVDIDKWREAKSREHGTMIQSRQIAKDLNLQMKIGDVEYQGDGNKAIFYYIADERVDFRQLIKVLAETFHVRIEMKQIGARQEAGRIGGTGPCGRELCCATWMKNFVSVSTGAARYQDISLNPQKLAGMCAKLKCCLNYEVDSYIEAGRKLPSREVVLQTMDGDHFLFKTDILAGLVTYSTDKRLAANLVTITAQRALEIVEMNRRGEKPDSLSDSDEPMTENHQVDLLAGESLTRFDKAKKKKKQKSRGNKAQDNKDAKAANANNQQPANNQQGGNQQASAENRKQRRAEGKQQRQEDKPQQQRQERVNNSSALITSHSVTPNLNALMLMATSRNRRTTVRGSADLSSRGMVETETADSVVVRENLTLPNSRSRRKPMTAATSKNNDNADMHFRHTILYIMTFAAVIVANVFASCTTDTVYDTYDHTPLSGWEKNDTLSFDVPKMKQAGVYSQSLGVRMTEIFPFTSVSLIVQQTVYPSGKVVTDTIKCPITDSRGNFLGDGVSAYQYSFPIREISLNKGDSLHICVRHNMKREILPGVSDIGVKIVKR